MAANVQLIVVPVGTSPLNDSFPDALVGRQVLMEAAELFKQGLTGREVIAALSVKWGAKEVIQAVAAGVGQRNFYDAVVKGRLYAANANPGEAS